MGALTLKSFPFDLRRWEIESFESLDPTDGFGANTRVYVNFNKVVLIEPDFDTYSSNIWISDKGRQFFDGIFVKSLFSQSFNKKTWTQLFKCLVDNLYMFDHFNSKKSFSTPNFFTIVFQNMNIESLSSLFSLSNKYSFLKVKKLESDKTNLDFESNFQLNLHNHFNRSNNSYIAGCSFQIGVLLSVNPRYEGYYLNLNLRQNFLKGDFKCILLGSLIDINFPIMFLGSNLSTLKMLLEGKSLISNVLVWSSEYPFFIYNNDLLKRHDGENICDTLKAIQNARNVFGINHGLWSKSNLLNPSIYNVGVNTLMSFSPFNESDSYCFSSMCFVNTQTTTIIPEFKRITELRLLHNYYNSLEISVRELNCNLHIKRLLLEQNHKLKETFQTLFFAKEKTSFFNIHLPTSHFYENSETLFNFEGFIKKTTKLVFNSETRNDWQIFRKLENHLKSLNFLTHKNNFLSALNYKRLLDFKNFISFKYFATQMITYLNFYLNYQNRPFIFDNRYCQFRSPTLKIFSTKLKFWLDDFYNGGKDGYSQNSIVLSECSLNLRAQSTNFF